METDIIRKNKDLKRTSENNMRVEEMSEFFTTRAEIYDEHMLNEVEGCRQGYVKMAELVPGNTMKLLDLGCGTGLELDEIFKKHPDIEVTGVDITEAMLEKLKKKHPDKNLTLVNADYLEYEFGESIYNAAVSFQTMHHFSHADKIKLYKKISRAIKQGGRYIEADYMAENQEQEDFYYSEYERIRKEQNIRKGQFVHYDTPCTVDNQIKMLETAGFADVRKVFKVGNTAIIVAEKK